MRGRSYSYSPSPPRGGYSRRRRRSPSPRGRYGARGRDLATSLLVRNLRHDCRTEDLRGPFGEFGPLKDIYLPRDYYTGEPRGFGFVQYVDPDDAAEAKYHMDGQTLLGRELTVVFAEENRKKPAEMRAKDRVRGRSYDRRSLSHYSSRYARSYSRSPGLYSNSSRRGRYSRSISPVERSYRERSYSRSPYYSRYRERSYSRSPYYSRYRERSYSRSPSPPSAYRGRSYTRSPYDGRSKYRERSYSRSPYRRSPSPVRGRSVSPEDY